MNAQSDIHIGHIGSEDGLTSQLCLHVVEDDFGNLWISSFQDLQKYDGYSVTKIERGKENQGDVINNLHKDEHGNIWIIQGELTTQENTKFWNQYSLRNKISIVDALTNEVVSFQDYIGSNKINSEDIVRVITHDEKLFLCSKDNTIYTFTDKLAYFTEVEDLQNVVTINTKSEIVLLENEVLLTKDADGKIVHQTNPQLLLEYESLTTSNSGGIFLIDSIDNEIIINEFNQNRIDHLISIDKNTIRYESGIFNKVEKYDEHQIFINGQLFIKNGNKKFKKVNVGRASYINEYFLSRTGLGYAATNLGVYVINNKKELFQKLAFDEKRKNSVRGIFVNKKFIAHKVYDHEIIVDKTGSNELGFLKNLDLGYMPYGHYLDPKNENHFWSYGLIEGRVRKIDFKNKKVDYVSFDGPNTINTILRSSLTSKLYTSSSGGPCVIDEHQMTISRLKVDTLLDNSIVTNHVVEKDGEIWFAMVQGVLRYDEANNEFHLSNIFKDKNSYPIQFMHEDKLDPQIVWLGTRRGGLVKWDSETDSIQIFNTNNGLSNNDVHAIIEDNSNRLWISTNRYLNCFDKNTNQIFIFTENDGLSDSEFNKHSFFYDKEQNEIYFGGLNGYNFFNPDSITVSDRTSRINVRIIDALKTKNDGKSENIFYSLIESNVIDFFEEDLSLEFGLSTNYLYDNEKIEFSYRIPKLSQEWKTQNSNILKLNRLPYGEFEIELISDLNKISFTSDILTLRINVVKPFWKTWLFLILTILSSILIIWWSIKKYFQFLKDRNTRLEEEVKARTEELTESNNSKNKLFAILAHDLRNPISSLRNFSTKIEYLKAKNRLDELDEIAKQTDAKLNALNENLDNILLWAIKESNLVGKKIVKVSLRNEVDNINLLYKDAITQKKLIMVNNIPDNGIVYADVTVVQTIIRNLVNNAIKFSYQGGAVEFDFTNKNGLKALKVIDHGIGLKDNENGSNAAKNNSIREKVGGTGIGLKICTELAVKSNLKLSLIPNPDGGAIGLLQFDEATDEL